MSDCNIPDPESIPLPEDIPLPPPSPASTEQDYFKVSNSHAPAQAPSILHRIEDVPLPKEEESHASRSFERRRIRKKRGLDFVEDAETLKEREMMTRMMGFSGFDSTKGKMVPGNQIGAVHVVKKRRYRQYMNRKGGFNRPLDKVA